MAIATRKKTEDKSVAFSIAAPGARRVTLAGSFNNWDSNSTPLEKSSKEGTWRRELTLKPGRYEYKFVIDGKWTNDPKNKSTVRNPFGTENSLIQV